MNHVIVAVIAFGIGVAFTHFVDSRTINIAMDLADYNKTRGDYYFNGANTRGYLELCYNENHELEVLYKDECVNEPK